MVATGDIVLVEGWQFVIDRTVPKIIDDTLGKGEFNEQIQIKANTTYTDYTNATITVEIEYEGEIETVTIDGKPAEITEDGKYTLKVEANKTYTIIAKDAEGKSQIETIKISEISEDFDIYNLADLKWFRDRVNNGATYEGRTVRVMADIDINKGKYTIGEENTITFEEDAEQWTPIGTVNTRFSGTFEGNNKEINGIYVKSDSIAAQSLFRDLGEKGIIRNLSVSGSIEIGANDLAARFASSNYGTIEKCVNKVNINGTEKAYGGIAGNSFGKIIKCANIANISWKDSIGGISGNNVGIIEECYNVGNIHSSYVSVGGICGHSGVGGTRNYY